MQDLCQTGFGPYPDRPVPAPARPRPDPGPAPARFRIVYGLFASCLRQYDNDACISGPSAYSASWIKRLLSQLEQAPIWQRGTAFLASWSKRWSRYPLLTWSGFE